ncbi:MAG: cell division protein FtsL [Lachnospiraceae bacterium]|nr:cell division protein FtsL [Lachnospiraceae bacterium]
MGRRNDAYVYGNTARALRPVEQDVRSPRRLKSASRKNIDRDTGMNPGFMLFMTLAMVLTGIVCVQYIRMQSSLTTYVGELSAMEMELQSLKAENDDYESRIKGAIGLENIKKRAMDELGMTYASDDQIVVYNSDGTDYVRQFVSLE